MLIVAGIAGQVFAGRHEPRAVNSGYLLGYRTGWSTTAYDIVLIGAWALIVLGAVIVAFSLVREIRKPG